MEFKLKGDYFEGSFHPITSPLEVIGKKCPADLSMHLWDCQTTTEHVAKVIHSAQQGFEVWRKLSLNQRIDYLKKFQEIVKKRKDEIARIICLEVGKPYWEALTEALALESKVNVTITDSLKRIQMETIKDVMPQIDGHTLKKPLGVTLIIGPFNFPCHLANGQILSSLLAGNSIIFKPSEKTSLSGQILIECFHEANFPSGVINLINGTAQISTELTKHHAVKGIFFTGSYNVGKKIIENTHQDITKLVALELGGKNASILHEDASMEHALAELLRASYLTSGQRCTSTTNIFVHQKILNEFTDRFTELIKKINVDHPLSETKPFMGPLIDEASFEAYFNFCEEGKKDGAKELVQAKKIKNIFNGYYASPSLFMMEKPNLSGKYFPEEIFGPHACIFGYDHLDQAISWANSTPYGLAASVFTRSKEIYQTCLSELDAGLINLNRSTVGATARLPFGGVKHSGNFHPAAVSMIDHCVVTVASLETLDDTSSKISDIVGLKA